MANAQSSCPKALSTWGRQLGILSGLSLWILSIVLRKPVTDRPKLGLSRDDSHSRATQTLKRLVTYAEKGGVLETHKDVPDEIQEELHLEEQQRQEKDKSKSGKVLGITPYPPININALPSQSVGLDTTASSATADPIVSKETSPLKIPRFRDVAVRLIWD